MTKRKHPGGRPTVWNEDVVQKLEEHFRLDCTDEEACAQAGVSESVYYKHLRDDSKFKKRMRAAQQFPFVVMKKTVIRAVNEGDGNLALKWLKNRQSERYQESSKLETDQNVYNFGFPPSQFIKPKKEKHVTPP